MGCPGKCIFCSCKTCLHCEIVKFKPDLISATGIVKFKPDLISATGKGIGCSTCSNTITHPPNLGLQGNACQLSKEVMWWHCKAVALASGLYMAMASGSAWCKLSSCHPKKPLAVEHRTSSARPSLSEATMDPGSTKKLSCDGAWFGSSCIKSSVHINSSNWVAAEVEGQK